ncbi:hypothetical protein SDC9_153303 [bioreactor metagenome]|uniref:Uncharacterized protein n=1 Tax=bioreactor metagenome TaxID=1076179 RepID=A0A645EY04_9ZZZZ
MLPYRHRVAVGAERVSHDGGSRTAAVHIRLQYRIRLAIQQTALPLQNVYEIPYLLGLCHQVGPAPDMGIQAADLVQGYVYPVVLTGRIDEYVLYTGVPQQDIEYPQAQRVPVDRLADVGHEHS